MTNGSGWESIENAPRDGTALLLLDNDEDFIVVGYWHRHQDGGPVTWRLCWNHDGFNATHWQPLPKPPIEGA